MPLSNLQAYKVNFQELSSSSKFDNLVQAVQDDLNNIDNAKVAALAAIAYSKLNLGNSIVNADIAAAAAIAYSKLNLASSIVNADIAAAAAIAQTKLAGAYDRSTGTTDVASSVTETSIYSKSITGNDMGTSRMLRLTLMGDLLYNNNIADTLTLRIKFGGTTFFADGGVASALGAARQPWVIEVYVANLGAANSQMIAYKWQMMTPNTAAPTTGIGSFAVGSENADSQTGGISTLGTIDTTTAQTLDVTAQWSASSANDSFRKRYGVLELV